MITVLASFLTFLGTAVVATVVTFFTTRRGLAIQYDANLRDHRIRSYTDLWRHMDVIAKYGRPNLVDRDAVKALNHELKTWYYQDGGIFLSELTRRDYFALQDSLELIAREDKRQPTEVDDEFLVVLGSRLRSGMTRDIGTRKTFMLRSDSVPPPEIPRCQVYDGGKHQMRVERHRRPNLGKGRRALQWVWSLAVTETLLVSEADMEGHWHRLDWTWQAERRGFAERPPAKPDKNLAFLEGDHLLIGQTDWSRLGPADPLLVTDLRADCDAGDGSADVAKSRHSRP